MDIIYLATVLLGTYLIFGHIQEIGGWSKNEVLLLVLTTSLIFDLLWTFFMVNLMFFSDLVREGNLDFALLKPVNPRFIVSTRYFEFDHYVRMPIIFYLIFKLVGEIGISPSLLSWLLYSISLLFGLLIVYCFFFMITTTNFWFIKIFNFSNLFDDVLDVARFPSSIYKNKLKYFFLYFIPSAFIAYFPVEILLGRRSWETVVFSGLVMFFLFIVSQKFWRFALKHYQSASS